jgi:hypothetical protein
VEISRECVGLASSVPEVGKLSSPDWLASGALVERQKRDGRRNQSRKAKALSTIVGKYAYKCCSRELELLHLRL